MAEGDVEGARLLRVCVVGDKVVGPRVVGAGVEGPGVAGVGVARST